MTLSARHMTLALLGARSLGATVCPSEVARAMAAGEDWRSAMPAVHTAVDRLLADKLISISWKGRPLETRVGPYRIGGPVTA